MTGMALGSDQSLVEGVLEDLVDQRGSFVAREGAIPAEEIYFAAKGLSN